MSCLPLPVQRSESQRACRNILHQWREPSCGWQKPCYRNDLTSSWSPFYWSMKLGILTMRCMLASHVASQVCFIQESVTTSCRISGALKSSPVRPNSSLMVLPDAWSRKPVRSWGWLENLSSMWMCANVCSVKRLGILVLQNLSGPGTSTWGKVWMNPADGSPCTNIGNLIDWHCSFVKVVARSGYISLQRRTLHN